MIDVNDKYKVLFEQPNGVRYYIVTGGRGSGKSFAVNLFLSYWTMCLNVKILFTRYTLTSANVSIIPEFNEKLEIINAVNDFDITKDEITHKESKSSILFKGLKTSSGNQTANLKSLQGVNCWVLDEAEELDNEETFDKIDLSIRSQKSNNIVILVLNPTTKRHWIYKRFFESKGVADGFNGIHNDTAYIHTDYRDNIGNLSDSFIRSVKNIEITDKNKYDHVILGGWIDKVEGVIFDNWIKGSFPDTNDIVYGLDFGYSSDPTALCKVHRHNNNIYIEEMIYKTSLTNSDLIREFEALNISKSHIIIADSAEPKSIEDLKRAGYRVLASKKGKDSINNGISFIKDNNITVCGKSPNLWNEFNMYAWDKNKQTGETLDKPIDKHNHLIDSFRYACEHYKKSKTIILY